LVCSFCEAKAASLSVAGIVVSSSKVSVVDSVQVGRSAMAGETIYFLNQIINRYLEFSVCVCYTGQQKDVLSVG
jgi:hypothetical protein